MKNTYLLLVLLIVSSYTTYGQDYHRLLNETTYWDISGAAMGYICTGFSDYPPSRYSFSGDTLVNGKVYAKSYSRKLIPIGYTPPPNCPPFYVDTIATVAGYYFLREDTIQKKVWRYDEVNDDEILLYDFSLEQGDTLYHEIIIEPTVIDTVYDIITSDGVVRKKFVVKPSIGDSYYIEGIGGVAGLFARPFQYFESGTWLMCVKDINNNLILDISGYCYDFITSIPKNPLENEINIYPNPFSDKVTIDFSDKKAKVEIYNSIGLKISDQSLEYGNSIDLSSYNDGIYLIKLFSQNKQVYQKLLVKSNGL